ncbi:MAG: hypothetical protein JSV21_03875 [Nitrospirota bacterium]|nr:MAG: hypothetical protein JSV21_03875 [Nitrospirota bacterium]
MYRLIFILRRDVLKYRSSKAAFAVSGPLCGISRINSFLRRLIAGVPSDRGRNSLIQNEQRNETGKKSA